MQVAARTYRAWKRALPSSRDLADAVVVDALLATIGTPEGMYGRRKMPAHLRRQGFDVSQRRVDRLMRDLGLNGRVRGRGVPTTTPDRNAERAPDLLERDFTAPAPNQRWVADFTYVRTWAEFVYVSFVIDCFSRAIVGWQASSSKTTPLMTTALRMGLWRRDRAGRPAPDGLVHHSDAGSQFTSLNFAETLALEGIAASIGSIGDAYDNALAETTIGLFKTEAIRDDSPFRSGPLKQLEDVEWVTAEWVDWYNTKRLHSTLGDVPPDEFEAAYHADLETPSHPALAPALERQRTGDGSSSARPRSSHGSRTTTTLDPTPPATASHPSADCHRRHDRVPSPKSGPTETPDSRPNCLPAGASEGTSSSIDCVMPDVERVYLNKLVIR